MFSDTRCVLSLVPCLARGSATMYASFVLFAYFRAALFGTMATEVAFTFGWVSAPFPASKNHASIHPSDILILLTLFAGIRHENFGKLWGILYCVSGLLNACIGIIAKQAAVEGTFFYINCALLGEYP